MSFAALFTQELDKAGVMPSEMARAINVHPATITNYMKGEREPNLIKLSAIAAYLGVSITALVPLPWELEPIIIDGKPYLGASYEFGIYQLESAAKSRCAIMVKRGKSAKVVRAIDREDNEGYVILVPGTAKGAYIVHGKTGFPFSISQEDGI